MALRGWARRVVGLLLGLLSVAGALGMPQDIFTWARCARYGGRLCDPIWTAVPIDLRSWFGGFDLVRAGYIGLVIIAILLLLPESVWCRRRPPAAGASSLRQEEHDLLVRARERGELHVLSTGQIGKFVAVGSVNYVDPHDPPVAARYRDALDSLCRRGLVRLEGGVLYRLTAEGFQVARRLQPRLKIELPEPVNPPGHRGPPYTPAWNVKIRLTATASTLAVVDVRLEEEGIGEWRREELSHDGVAVSLPLQVTSATEFWFRASSPRTFERGPVQLGKLTIRVRDHFQPTCDSHDLGYGPVTTR